MPDYQKMYLDLFNSVTDAIELLQKAQQDAEESYISQGEPEGYGSVEQREKRKKHDHLKNSGGSCFKTLSGELGEGGDGFENHT